MKERPEIESPPLNIDQEIAASNAKALFERFRSEGHEPTVQRLALLVFLSFRFSQGDPEKQKNLTKYLHALYPHLWPTDDKFYDDVRRKSTKMAEIYIKNNEGVKHPSPVIDVPGSVRTQVDFLKSISDKPPAEIPHTIDTIINDVINRDIYFLKKEGGRPHKGVWVRGATKETQLPPEDYTSQLVLYCLQGKNTGTSEYNLMFQLMKERLQDWHTRKPEDAAQTLENLNKLIALHNEKNPEDKVDLNYYLNTK